MEHHKRCSKFVITDGINNGHRFDSLPLIKMKLIDLIHTAFIVIMATIVTIVVASMTYAYLIKTKCFTLYFVGSVIPYGNYDIITYIFQTL